MSKGIISDRTLLENHPYVDDVDTELERIEKEQKNRDTQLFGDMNDEGVNQDEE